MHSVLSCSLCDQNQSGLRNWKWLAHALGSIYGLRVDHQALTARWSFSLMSRANSVCAMIRFKGAKSQLLQSLKSALHDCYGAVGAAAWAIRVWFFSVRATATPARRTFIAPGRVRAGGSCIISFYGVCSVSLHALLIKSSRSSLQIGGPNCW